MERLQRLFPHWGWLALGGLVLLLALGGRFLLASTGRAAGGLKQAPGGILAQDLVLTGADFGSGESKGPLSKDSGLVLTLPETGVYTSAVIAAPLPFSDLGCSWEIDLPNGATMLVEVRTSPDGQRWTPWTAFVEAYEGPAPSGGEHAAELIPISQQDGVHNQLQYRLSFSALQADTTVHLRRLTFHLIDARAGPSTSEIMANQPKGELNRLEKPPVITRDQWGCPEGENSPRWPQEYETVTHVIVHHTATANDDTDWAARVRAIWYYHANTRGWGDIGYNFVIDPLGNIYEGRAGGNDVVGGHAHDYNYGTMGVGCLGTYSYVSISERMKESLEALIAWKANRRNIDPLGRSFNSHKVYDNIAGHRDVGQTTCPGDVFYALLPAIRQDVADILAQQEASIVVDDQDPGFSRSDAYWHDTCGVRDHGLWTHTTTDPSLSSNWGIWRPTLAQTGQYEVWVYVPSCVGDLPEYTESAHYRVYYRGGGTSVVVDQKTVQGHWVSLGTFPFEAGTGGYVYLDDMADDHWRALFYDAARWDLLSPAPLPPIAPRLQDPPEAAWQGSLTVQLSWTLPTTMTVDRVHLVVATNPDLTSPLLDTELPAVQQYTLVLPQEYPNVYWSAQAGNPDGYSNFAPTRRFRVDVTPPTSNITALYRSTTGIYLLTWTGSDQGSGVASYTVQIRHGLGGEWQDLWTDVPWHSGLVQPSPGETDYYRVQARDELGNQEPAHEGDGDLNSDQVTALTWGWNLPLVLRHAVLPTPPVQPTHPLPTNRPAQPTQTPGPTVGATASPTPIQLPTMIPPTGTSLPTMVPPTETALPTLPPPTGTPSPTPVPLQTATPFPSPTPGGPLSALPDLVVVALRSSQSTPFDCGKPTGIAVTVRNSGAAPAGPFYLVLQGPAIEDCRWRLEDLQPNEEVEKVCPIVDFGGVITATVDVEGMVSESDEANNTFSQEVYVLKLPPCTPRPTP